MVNNVVNRTQLIRAAYSTAHPCPPKLFVGREEQMSAYRDIPAPKFEGLPPQPSNIVFIGEWGIGKTSILNHIVDISTSSEFFTIDLVRDFRTVNDLLVSTLKNVCESVSRLERLKGLAEKLKRAGISPIGIPGRDRLALTDMLAKTWSILERGGVEHCSILIDDINHLSEVDLKTVRDIFQRLPLRGCNYSIAATSTYGTFARSTTDPVARFFEAKKYILPFTKKELAESIRTPIDILNLDISFNDEYLEALQSWSLGYPYFAKFITRELAIKYKKLEASHLEKHRKDLLSAMGTAKFAADFSRAPGDAGKRILLRMAKERRGEYKAGEFKDIDKQYSAYLDQLREKELLNRKERGTYAVYHPLFLEWLRAFVLEKGNEG